MRTVQDFINVYSNELVVGTSMSDSCAYTFKTGYIQYTDYNGKIEITILLKNDEPFSHASLVYDEGMDWVVITMHGSCSRNIRKHYKQVSKGKDDVITPEVFKQILLIKENMLMDRIITTYGQN